MIGQYEKMQAEERLENLALWDALKKQKPNIPLLREMVAELCQLLTQKTAGQRKGKPKDVPWGRLPYVKMAILAEAVALVMGGALDNMEEDDSNERG